MIPDSMAAVFVALAHAVRRKILDVVKERPGCSLKDVCDYFDISRIAVMKHLRVLEQANLVVAEKAGRSRKLYFNAVPIQMIYDRWTTEYSAYWSSHMTQIKYRIESARSKPTERSAPAADPPEILKRKRHA